MYFREQVKSAWPRVSVKEVLETSFPYFGIFKHLSDESINLKSEGLSGIIVKGCVKTRVGQLPVGFKDIIFGVHDNCARAHK